MRLFYSPTKIDTTRVEVLAVSMSASVQLLYTAIGVIMIYCLAHITKAIASLPANQSLNIKTLLIHAGAFVFFMAGALSFAVFFTLYMFNYPTEAIATRNLMIVDCVYGILTFLS